MSFQLRVILVLLSALLLSLDDCFLYFRILKVYFYNGRFITFNQLRGILKDNPSSLHPLVLNVNSPGFLWESFYQMMDFFQHMRNCFLHFLRANRQVSFYQMMDFFRHMRNCFLHFLRANHQVWIFVIPLVALGMVAPLISFLELSDGIKWISLKCNQWSESFMKDMLCPSFLVLGNIVKKIMPFWVSSVSRLGTTLFFAH